MKQRVVFRFLLGLGLLALLLGCESEQMKETEFSIQQSRFMLSVELVEGAGKALQSPTLNQVDIDRSLQQLDNGLGYAFEVKKDFLQRLDVRLPKLYSEMFIHGIESYRLGVESSDRQQQLEGLNLLSQWNKFWVDEKDSIQKRLVELNARMSLKLE